MNLSEFLNKIKANEAVGFNETIALIAENYAYQPTQFSNGTLINESGKNEGSCKIFAFAALHGLSEQQTLNLFGDYYQKDVLQNPEGTDHQNIRNFMQGGWAGIKFSGSALTAK